MMTLTSLGAFLPTGIWSMRMGILWNCWGGKILVALRQSA
jgi:hypothetical protein